MANPYFRDAENQLLRILDDPDLDQISQFTPLVLHGPSGVGKTAVARYLVTGLWLNHGFDESEVLALSGAGFYRSYASSVETNSVADWRERFSPAKILIIDGLQQMLGKSEAQLELRWLIDEFLNFGKLLICTSLEPVESLDGLAPSLSSRLIGGLAVPLSVPGIDVRKEFLKKVSADLNISFTPDAVDKLAEQTADVFPALRNAAILIKSQIKAKQKLPGTTPGNSAATKNITAEAVEDYLRSATRAQPDLRGITGRVAKYFNVKLGDMKGPSRKQSIVRARSIAIYLTRVLSDSSLDAIGSFLGGRDHTTVLHAFRKIERQLLEDQLLQAAVAELTADLQK